MFPSSSCLTQLRGEKSSKPSRRRPESDTKSSRSISGTKRKVGAMGVAASSKSRPRAADLPEEFDSQVFLEPTSHQYDQTLIRDCVKLLKAYEAPKPGKMQAKNLLELLIRVKDHRILLENSLINM